MVVISCALASTSSEVSRLRNDGSSMIGLPFLISAIASLRRCFSRSRVEPMREAPVRSLPSRNFAQSQPLVLLADQLIDRNLDVLEEALVDLGAALHGVDGAYGHAGALHVHQQEGDAFLLLRLGVGADQKEHPVRVLRVGGPHLGTVDDVIVAFAARRGCAARRGRSRSRAPKSPGTTSRRDWPSAAGSASSVPPFQNAQRPGRTGWCSCRSAAGPARLRAPRAG